MRTYGAMLVTLGILLCVAAFVIYPSTGSYSGVEIVNIHLLNTKALLGQVGGSLIVAGCVLLVGARLAELLGQRADTAKKSDQTPRRNAASRDDGTRPPLTDAPPPVTYDRRGTLNATDQHP